MQKLLKKFGLVFFILCLPLISLATHNQAGEIRLVPVGTGCQTFKAIVTTYTKENSQADRPELTLYWGDGDSTVVPRINVSGVSVGNGTKMNLYEGTHAYTGPNACYTVSFEDPNRNQGVINIPNSVNTPFYVYTQVCINAWVGCNSTPLLLNPPIDEACNCKKFIHNPGAFDAEGDDLRYKLVACRGAGGNTVPGYTFPSGMTIDSLSGDLVWPCPGSSSGEYNVAIEITEYRIINNKRYKVGLTIRDMQITVKSGCINNPPVITDIPDKCVIAGTLVQFDVIATDSDTGDLVTLTGSGGPFTLSNPASFPSATSHSPVTSTFSWQTNCANLRIQPYTVTFKATDNDSPNHTDPLSDLKTISITVVCPKPTNVNATPQGNSMVVTWNPSFCSETNKYFIYRKIGCSSLIPGDCETGMPASWGYTLIGTNTGWANTTFTDNNGGPGLISGVSYSYRVVANFANGAKSYVSDEDCAELVRDIPLITHVTVDNTGTANGAITVSWAKPITNALNLDTNQFTGPYTYNLYRTDGINGTNYPTVPVASFSKNYFHDLTDTTYTDSNAGFDTETKDYRYKIEFIANSSTGSVNIGNSSASSVFLTLAPNDNQLELVWNYNVPWLIDSVQIFKKVNGVFILLAKTTASSYIDYGLTNGSVYCYYVKTFGSYSTPGIISPLINFSQIACGVPKDITPPCSPTLAVEPDCDNFKNVLTWNNPNNFCTDDVVKYNIYFATNSTSSFGIIKTITNSTDTSYTADSLLNSIAGCYLVTAVDSFANESKVSDTVCVDNCPVYELPNVFTPNGDGFFDLFTPLPGYRFIQDIDLVIYDRWGLLVFKTTNKAIKWDGKNINSGKQITDGVYYYVCIVNQIKLEGIVPKQLKGFVQVFNEGEKKP